MKKTETKSTVLLAHHLKSLRLPTIHAECGKVAARCAADNIDHLAFLLQLCELELLDRERRASDRRLKDAKFPSHKTLDSFDFKSQPSINEVLVTELLRGEYIDKKENVLLVGNSGTGKTHLAVSLGLCACRHGPRTKFFTAATLVTQLEEAQKQFALDRMLKRLDKLDLLIVGGLGYLSFSRSGAELLFQVFADRYERRSLLITSNLAFSDWGQSFQGERMTAALLDRLAAMFATQAALDFEKQFLSLQSDRKVELLLKADQLEEQGLESLAAELRKQAESLSLESPLASTNPVLGEFNDGPAVSAVVAEPRRIPNETTNTTTTRKTSRKRKAAKRR